MQSSIPINKFHKTLDTENGLAAQWRCQGSVSNPAIILAKAGSPKAVRTPKLCLSENGLASFTFPTPYRDRENTLVSAAHAISWRAAGLCGLAHQKSNSY